VKKIVLQDLPADIRDLINARVKSDNVGHRDAVIAILNDAAIERMVEHDLAIMQQSWAKEEEHTGLHSRTCHHCCCHHACA
jgi:hypothetical protein